MPALVPGVLAEVGLGSQVTDVVAGLGARRIEPPRREPAPDGQRLLLVEVEYRLVHDASRQNPRALTVGRPGNPRQSYASVVFRRLTDSGSGTVGNAPPGPGG